MALYTEDILALAGDLTHATLPADATIHGRFSNPLCGDTVTIAAVESDGVLRQLGFEAQACAVCRASAAALCRLLEGERFGAFEMLLENLERSLDTGEGAARDELASLVAVHPFRSRHSCVLLPWRALEQAFLPVPEQPLSDVSQSLDGSETSPWKVALDVVERGNQAAIATLVSVEGSSPCPLGAHMVVASTGEFWGSVSGGCVESAVVQAAVESMTGVAPASRTIAYQISNSQAGEVGLPCGGRIEVHVTKAPGREALVERVKVDGTKLNVIDLTSGAMTLLDDDGRLAPAVERDGPAFVERIGARERLLIVGGTHIAQKLAVMASELDFDVVVLDPRPHLASQTRFPGIELVVERPEDALAQLITPNSSVVMLTHDKAIDDPALTVALRSRARYVAALGSRKTQKARLERLRAAGLSADELARLHGPAGLAIGAVGAGEIALSILAEVVAERRAADRVRPKVAGVVLAAGSSKRAGSRNKLLQAVDGRVMIRQVVENACAADLSPCVVVLGHEAEQVRAALDGLPVEFVENAEHQRGMGTSIAAGISALPDDVSAAVVVLGDMPDVEAADIERLVAAHQPSTQHLIVAPEAGHGDERRLGNPVLWPRRYFDELASLDGDRGAKYVMLRAPGAVLRIAVENDGVLRDYDTIDEPQLRRTT